MKKSSAAQMCLRVVIYILGLFFLSVGVVFSLNANFGISPVNSLPYVISQIVNIPMSTSVIAVFCSYIVMQILILRKDFKLINLTQIIFSTIFGYFVDFAKWMMGAFTLPGFAGRILMLAISIVIISFGVLLYIEAQLVPMPMEGLTLAITGKQRRFAFPTMKMIVDCAVVCIGIVLDLIFFRKLVGIGLGTVVSALLIGKVIGIMKKPVSPVIERICFSRDGGGAPPEPAE